MEELIKRVQRLLSEIRDLKGHLNLAEKERKLSELEGEMQSPGFWNDNESAQRTAKQHGQLKAFYGFWDGLERECGELLGLVLENTDESQETIDYLAGQAKDLEQRYAKNRFVALLSRTYDDHNAIFSVHSGAGGVDAQDWADMLLRMFLRYCDRRGFVTDIVELSRGEQGGLKTAVVSVAGPYAFGLLKSEAGVHRLVRLSPFNPAHTRETSFALMELLPELERQEEFAVDPKDLKIEANTASGHGGQSVNTTYSAIRITHIPTGIRVSIQNERSQHQNRDVAMKILMAKLKALDEEKLKKEKQDLRGEYKSAEWGNQIRSYVLHPYKLVKDHRTNFESTDPDSVLNGELDEFVEKYLERFGSQ